ncbi:MAG TPA: sigma-70 family RNA polymerase sigma factor [Prolixibacteraceae bacterium]|nr:sigma-70 family RNA polymerase sigma factor [Prolixibacteraceae bacterium]
MVKLSEHTDDKVLWHNLKAGDKHCFNRIFRKYYSELYYYGIKIFPAPDFVKECIQEVFIRVWETRKSLAEVENVKSYLIVSVRRMILVQKGKDKTAHNIEIGQAENYSFFFDVNEFEKHEEISDEMRQTLLTAINSLTKNQREMIMLFFYHELTYPEIAQIFEISIPAARNLMYRSLIHLRETIGEKSLNTMKNMFFLLFPSVSVKKME